jgi:hypothetical protein
MAVLLSPCNKTDLDPLIINILLVPFKSFGYPIRLLSSLVLKGGAAKLSIWNSAMEPGRGRMAGTSVSILCGDIQERRTAQTVWSKCCPRVPETG